jgi:cysteine desulfurase
VRVSQDLSAARNAIAKHLHAQPDEIIFTHGGTESNNLALQGVIHAFREKNPHTRPHVIMSAIEHAAVRETLLSLQRKGLIDLDILDVDNSGKVRVVELKALLRRETILVSVVYASNEIGVIQPIREIAKTLRWFKKHYETSGVMYPLFHTDAIQAAQYQDIHTQRLGVDLMTLSAAKMYGPKGVALLYCKKGTPVQPLVYGGGQESGMRSGTENVSLIMGFAKALDIACEMKDAENKRLQSLRDYFMGKLESLPIVPIVNGDREDRIVNNISVSFPGFSSEQLVVELDAQGVMVSSQSACSVGRDDGSYAVQALRPDTDTTDGTLRFTMGRSTKKKDIDVAVGHLEKILKKLQQTKIRFEK